ncbi:hypothetical protein AID08_08720 [Salmonella enterica subsp. enterica serovar Minnesota]|nr:hypothetical protein [Salmonella enterica subsp. enterica serovar Minnesota]EBZ3811591.1 hypothetical protein [Salmonella enterica subsp. enterica serovar Minnesota]EGG4263532.1 hypothetical protein [Salmonella enterica]EGG4290928.1 hypothetical protein [Salmonella enterica]HCJ1000197.1 hypothetical protein [Salmonella enterica]
MNLPNGFAHLSGGSTYLSENDIAKIPQLAPQPVQPAQPVQMAQPLYYAVQPQPQPQPQQRQYVFLPWIPDPKKAKNLALRLLLQERVDVINFFIDGMNKAGVLWVSVNTGKDCNGAQVLPPVSVPDSIYKLDDKPADES